MKTQSIDTNIKAEQIIISLMKEKSIADKFAIIHELSQTTMELSMRAIARANKNYNENRVRCKFVEVHYGKELAKKYSNYINERCEPS